MGLASLCDNSFEGKPVATTSVSTGVFGGARAQQHLRQTLVALNMHPVNRPEVTVVFAGQKVGAEDRVKDETTRKIIEKLVRNLFVWTKKLRMEETYGLSVLSPGSSQKS